MQTSRKVRREDPDDRPEGYRPVLVPPPDDDGPESADRFADTFSAMLPLVLMAGAAAVRLAGGFARGEPMDATMTFLCVVLALCAIGLIGNVVSRIKARSTG